MGFEEVQEDAHRRVKAFPAVATGDRPHALQRLARVVGIFPGPRFRGCVATCLPSPGGRLAALVKRRRALLRDNPVTVMMNRPGNNGDSEATERTFLSCP